MKKPTADDIIKAIFSLEMHDSFGYGNAVVYVHHIEEAVKKYGYTREKILKLLKK